MLRFSFRNRDLTGSISGVLRPGVFPSDTMGRQEGFETSILFL